MVTVAAVVAVVDVVVDAVAVAVAVVVVVTVVVAVVVAVVIAVVGAVVAVVVYCCCWYCSGMCCPHGRGRRRAYGQSCRCGCGRCCVAAPLPPLVSQTSLTCFTTVVGSVLVSFCRPIDGAPI